MNKAVPKFDPKSMEKRHLCHENVSSLGSELEIWSFDGSVLCVRVRVCVIGVIGVMGGCQ